MTIKSWCSDIKALLKIDNGDVPLNDRLIYQETISTAILLIKREINQRRLTSGSSIYTLLPCVTMQEVPLAECCDFSSSKTISRSKNKLPKIVDSLGGLAVEYVADVETQRGFTFSTPLRYKSILDLPGNKNKLFFWFKDDYLYVSSNLIKKVAISALFESELLLKESICDCETEDIDCSPIYERDLKIPSYLLENVKTMLLDKLGRIYFGIPSDKTDNDSNETSR